MALQNPIEINDLPNDLLIELFSYLPLTDVANTVRYVCMRWKCLSYDLFLWKRFVYKVTSHHKDKFVMLFFQNNPQLQSVIFETEVTGTVLKQLYLNCRHLTSLTFYQYQEVSANILDCFRSHCLDLSVLAIPDYVLQDYEMAYIVAQMKQLRTLKLLRSAGFQSSMSELSLKSLAEGCPNLRKIDLTDTWATLQKEDFEHFLIKKEKLVSLAFTGTKTDDICVIPLLRIRADTLTELYITRFEHNSDIKILKLLRNLEVLYLYLIKERISLNDVADLFECGSLRYLVRLSLCQLPVGDRILRAICLNCSKLEVLMLKLVRNEALTDFGLEFLYRLERLHKLNLYNCTQLTSKGANHIAQCIRIQELVLAGCCRLKPSEMFFNQLKHMRALVLDDCDISDLPWGDLRKCMPFLKMLSVQCCEGVSREFFVEVLPHLNLGKVELLTDS